MMRNTKIRLVGFLFCSCLAISAFASGHKTLLFDSEGRKTLAIATGRSGNHWFRYSLQYLTERRCGDNRFNLYFDKKKPVICAQHNVYQVKGRDPNRDYLILLVRNYKECMLRGNDHDIERIKEMLTDEKVCSYFHNLEVFNRWHPKRRILVYYEDLIDHPRETLGSVLDLIGESRRRLPDFIKNIEKHRQKTLAYYDRTHKGARSRGKDHLFHSKQEAIEDLEEIDEMIIDRWPTLFEKYLTRYKS